jgi:hypothetical protein
MSARSAPVFTLTALLTLALAATTGVLLRMALVYGMAPGLGDFDDIRHAHSHLMFNGWAMLGLMTLIWRWLPRYTGRALPGAVTWQMAATAFFALLTLPAFWINGYGLTQIGPAMMPLGAIIASLNGLTWFLFMFLYFRATRALVNRPPALQLWDWAIILLLVASIGAAGVPVIAMIDLPVPFLEQAFLHLFLDVFSVGWMMLALLGAIWAWLPSHSQPAWLPTRSLALLLVFTFVLGMSPSDVPRFLFWIVAIINLGAAGLLGVHLLHLWRGRSELPALVQFGLLGLAVQVIAAVVLLWPGMWEWAAGWLRVFYLHNLLLLWASSVLLGLLLEAFASGWLRWRRWLENLWMTGVGVMWLALLGLGLIRWLPISGRVLLQIAAASSVVVVLAVLMAFPPLIRSRNASANQSL